jgi:hypothetical protein
MGLQLPVVWTLHGLTSHGRIDVSSDRVTLTSKHRVFSFPLRSIAAYTIDRAPARRLRGLPVLVLKLAEGEMVLIGSMGGPGSLQELTSAVGRLQLVPSGT